MHFSSWYNFMKTYFWVSHCQSVDHRLNKEIFACWIFAIGSKFSKNPRIKRTWEFSVLQYLAFFCLKIFRTVDEREKRLIFFNYIEAARSCVSTAMFDMITLLYQPTDTAICPMINSKIAGQTRAEAVVSALLPLRLFLRSQCVYEDYTASSGAVETNISWLCINTALGCRIWTLNYELCLWNRSCAICNLEADKGTLSIYPP